MSDFSRPKTLAERLQWMSDNLPGFRDQLELVRVVEVSTERSCSRHGSFVATPKVVVSNDLKVQK